jgi:hypothetical protein
MMQSGKAVRSRVGGLTGDIKAPQVRAGPSQVYEAAVCDVRDMSEHENIEVVAEPG